jgi:hypothetical protein
VLVTVGISVEVFVALGMGVSVAEFVLEGAGVLVDWAGLLAVISAVRGTTSTGTVFGVTIVVGDV